MTLDARALDQRLAAAAALAREAGRSARRRFADRSSFSVGLKGPQDFLTEVDSEVERLLFGRLGELFPADGFLGEEGQSRPAQGDAPIWVVDPIDGTANFVRGVPRFCLSIGLAHAVRPVLGVIYDPSLDELFTARRGGGAFLDSTPIRVSTTPDMRSASIEVGWNMRTEPEKFLGLMRRVVESGSAVQRCGSGALGLAFVAAGRSDGFIEPRINSWDCVAGLALVEEAGGHVNDFLARDGLNKGNALLACTPGVAEFLREAAKAEGVEL